jgi:hypothetical protein
MEHGALYSPYMVDEAGGVRGAVLVKRRISRGTVGILARRSAILNGRASCHIAGQPSERHCVVRGAVVDPKLLRSSSGSGSSWRAELLHPRRLATNGPEFRALESVRRSKGGHGDGGEDPHHFEM